MGRKDAKLTAAATSAAEFLVAELSELGLVRSRKMFGGYGVFGDDVMFALVSSEGRAYFKIGDGNRSLFEGAESERFGKMPYSSIPLDVLENRADLLRWARAAIAVSKESRS